jgi:tRNA pseudouridine synthase 10
MREKTIYKIDGHYLKPKLSEFVIETQGGTYIKELIHGDNGRTTPSFSSIFGFQTICKELDVLAVKR